MIGETADSIVFFTLAFYAIIPNADLVVLVFTQAALKTAYEVIALPITNILVKWVKKKEEVDTFDNDISYNPLKIKDL